MAHVRPQATTFLADHPRRDGASGNGLAGKPRPKSRTDSDGTPRAPAPVPVNQRLGFRPAEFAALTGVTYVTVWRAIKRGEIEVVYHCGIKIIPRAFAVKAGFLSDTVEATDTDEPQATPRRGRPRRVPADAKV